MVDYDYKGGLLAKIKLPLKRNGRSFTALETFVFLALTRNARDQFEGSQNSKGP